MNLHLPPMSAEPQMAKLSKGDERWLAGKLMKEEKEREIRPMVISSGESISEDPRVEELREAIHRDYDGVVLGTEVIPDPPERGPYGYAFIPLKENAVPCRQRPFVMHGERLEGTKESQRNGSKKSLSNAQRGGRSVGGCPPHLWFPKRQMIGGGWWTCEVQTARPRGSRTPSPS